MTIGALDKVFTGQQLRITLQYSAVFPEVFLTEAGVIEAAQLAGFNVVDVDVDTLPMFRKIVVGIKVVNNQSAGMLGRNLAEAILRHFKSIFDVRPEKYEIISEPLITAKTTISLVAVAMIVLVGGFVFWKMRVGR